MKKTMEEDTRWIGLIPEKVWERMTPLEQELCHLLQKQIDRDKRFKRLVLK